MLYRLARPAIFTLPEETAHNLTLAALRKGAGKWYPQKTIDKPVQVMGLTFRNPVGLAAGLDKNADCIDGLADLDRKSTRLNSSHVSISYAVFCLKKKNNRA